jgi:hypothetical protein
MNLDQSEDKKSVENVCDYSKDNFFEFPDNFFRKIQQPTKTGLLDVRRAAPARLRNLESRQAAAAGLSFEMRQNHPISD